jgi:hypothetical protein
MVDMKIAADAALLIKRPDVLVVNEPGCCMGKGIGKLKLMREG